MNLLISCDNNFLKPVASMLYSFSKHHKDEQVDVYCASWNGENDPTENLDKILGFCKNIHIIRLQIPNLSQYKSIDCKRWNNIILLRLLAPFYLPDNVDRLLYIDGDIIFRNNIKDFYYQKLDENLLVVGAREHYADIPKRCEQLLISDSLYINSGFIIINTKDYVKKFVNPDILYKTFSIILDRIKYPDQDILNYICSEKKKGIDNYVFFPGVKWSKLKKCPLVHFTTPPKPWDKSYYGFHNFIFWKYGKKIYGFKTCFVLIIRSFFNDFYHLFHFLWRKITRH